jgi:hypothetical protein
MGLKIMRLITQPYMENGVQVYAPGDLLEMSAPAELGGRIVVVDDADTEGGPAVPAEAETSVAATVPPVAPARPDAPGPVVASAARSTAGTKPGGK